MATNKNALIRYKTLDQCFRNIGKRYFITDLISNCNEVMENIDPNTKGISRRQIFDDIAFMESAEGWSIDLIRHKIGKQVFYRYSDTTFSINNMPLNEMEINHLSSAIDILGQFRGMPQFQWIQEIVPKLRQGIISPGQKQPIMEFDSNEYLKGIENLGEIYNSIFYKKTLRITYCPFINQNSYEFIFHPYYLRQYNNRWFVYGYNPNNEKYDWNLALDRILSISEEKIPYKENSSINWSEYFEDIIGVTRPEGVLPEKILIQFKGVTGKYIESKPLHGSQKSRWIDPDTLEVSLDLIINYELERMILSYCDTIIIISPESLRKRISARLLQASINSK